MFGAVHSPIPLPQIIPKVHPRCKEVERAIKNLRSVDVAVGESLNSQLDAMTNALVKKILHDPTIFLKESRDPSRQQFARDLFNLDGRNRRRGNT